MSLFMLDTDIVSSSAGAVKSLATQLGDLVSTVSGYDTDCEDGFDFAGAKKTISGNIDACVTKLNNTALYMDKVVTSHTELQTNEFVDPAEKERLEQEKTTEKDQKKNSSSSNRSSSSSNRSSSSSRSSSSRSSNSSSSHNVGTASSSTKKILTSADLATMFASFMVSRVGEIKEPLKKIDYTHLNLESVSDATKEFFQNKDLKFIPEGFAMIGSRYVIACDLAVGNVGDVVSFTKNDGTVVECVIGHNTFSEKYRDTINFIVNSDQGYVIETKDTSMLLEDVKKVENRGPLKDILAEEAKNNATNNTTTSTETATEGETVITTTPSQNENANTSTTVTNGGEVNSQNVNQETPNQTGGDTVTQEGGTVPDSEQIENIEEIEDTGDVQNKGIFNSDKGMMA